MYMLLFQKEKRKIDDWTIFLNPFTVCSSCKLTFFVGRLLTKKQMEIIRLQTD
jgi:hypothetical protein